jgi:hypothetical protein
MGRSKSVNNLERALNTLLEDARLVAALAAILAHASKTGTISYREVIEIAGDNAEEALLLGNQWRLLFPIRVEKSSAWEDRLLQCKAGESYELPNVVRYLVQSASKTGCWTPMKDVAEVFKVIGEPAWQKMPEAVAKLGKRAQNGQISATEIKQICASIGLADKVDVLIAELKAAGVMSPKLGALAQVSKAGSPLYELNPSLFIKKGKRDNDWSGAKTRR